MSVTVALTTQCAYCIESHSNNAVQAGASREEIAETVFIAAALWAAGAVERFDDNASFRGGQLGQQISVLSKSYLMAASAAA